MAGGGLAILIEGLKKKGKKPDEDIRKLLRSSKQSPDKGMMSEEPEEEEQESDSEDPVDLFLEAIGAPVNNSTRKAFKLAVTSCQDSEYSEEELPHMPSTVTQSALRARIRTVVRQPNAAGFISDTELNRLINEEAYALYDLLIQARGELYYTKEFAFNTVVQQRRYVLPLSFYRLVGIVITEGGGTPPLEIPLYGAPEVTPPVSAHWAELRVMHPADWAKQDSSYGCNYMGLRYNLTGTGNAGTSLQNAELALYPVPSAVHCINIRYIPVLDLSGDPIDGEPVYDGINGWEEYIVYSVASTVAGMQEESNDLWLRKKGEIEARIRALAFNRDRSQPMQVADRWGAYDEYPWGPFLR